MWSIAFSATAKQAIPISLRLQSRMFTRRQSGPIPQLFSDPGKKGNLFGEDHFSGAANEKKGQRVPSLEKPSLGTLAEKATLD